MKVNGEQLIKMLHEAIADMDDDDLTLTARDVLNKDVICTGVDMFELYDIYEQQ